MNWDYSSSWFKLSGCGVIYYLANKTMLYFSNIFIVGAEWPQIAPESSFTDVSFLVNYKELWLLESER